MRPVTKSRGLAIGTLSRHTGVKVETIRYYERRGLLPTPPRAAGGHRRYDSATLQRLSFIRHARALGFPLDDIALLLRAEDGELTCAEARRIGAAHLAAIRGRIDELQKVAGVLQRAVGQCDTNSAPHCPIIGAIADNARPRLTAPAGGSS